MVVKRGHFPISLKVYKDIISREMYFRFSGYPDGAKFLTIDISLIRLCLLKLRPPPNYSAVQAYLLEIGRFLARNWLIMQWIVYGY